MTSPSDDARPEHLTLGALIEILQNVVDPTRVVAIGFDTPHSYRGDYSELAFTMCRDATVATMLEAARSALGATYQGWKGGEYTMDAYTYCWIVEDTGMTGETLGALLLSLMLGP